MYFILTTLLLVIELTTALCYTVSPIKHYTTISNYKRNSYTNSKSVLHNVVNSARYGTNCNSNYNSYSCSYSYCNSNSNSKSYNNYNKNKNKSYFQLNSKQTTTEQEQKVNEKKSLEELIILSKSYEDEAFSTISISDTSNELEQLRVAYIGKNGKISGLMKDLRNLSKEEKPKFGEIINTITTKVEELLVSRKEFLKEKELLGEIEKNNLGNSVQISSVPGLSHPFGTRHPLSLTLDLACSIFEEIGYEIIEGPKDSPEIENDFYNFEALGMPPNHPARDMQDTFYINTTSWNVKDTLLLRTHTSAVQIREMEKRKPPFKICAPGRVYRKDDVDATHYPAFHQVEILAIDEMGKLTVPHLLGTVKYFLQKMFGPEIDVKYRASYFPFTEPSIEVDVFFRGRWLEVLGCGMVDPVVLEAVGYDPTKYSGFAAGFGIERFAMIMHNIQDIRLFWENNVEFLSQFPSTTYAISGDDDEAKLRDPTYDPADDK